MPNKVLGIKGYFQTTPLLTDCKVGFYCKNVEIICDFAYHLVSAFPVVCHADKRKNNARGKPSPIGDVSHEKNNVDGDVAVYHNAHDTARAESAA